jgi:mRNA interferase MazF
VNRGEVWWANLPQPVGPRPVVLLSRDEAYRRRSQITIAPVTTVIRNIPTEVRLGPADGMARECVVNVDSMATIAKSALDRYITTLSASQTRAIEHAIHFALDLSF